MMPLARTPTALAAAMSVIDDDIVEIAATKDASLGTTSPVEFEWIGLDHALEGRTQKTRGANTTSIDAFVIAETESGRRAYLIEWKYVEEYRSRYLGNGNPGAKRLRRYAKAYAKSPFLPGNIPVEAWFYEPFYQIMRQRLLADRMVRKGELGVREAKVVVVVPEGNSAYRRRITSPALAANFPNARTVVDVVRAAISRHEEAFAFVSPTVLADAARRRCPNEIAGWSDYVRDRYGW